MVQHYLNGTKLYNFMKYYSCSAHFTKGKRYLYQLNFAFSSIQTVHAFTIIILFFVSTLQNHNVEDK